MSHSKDPKSSELILSTNLPPTICCESFVDDDGEVHYKPCSNRKHCYYYADLDNDDDSFYYDYREEYD